MSAQREWKPGDVALVPFMRGEVRAMRVKDGDREYWVLVDHPTTKVTEFEDVRPLVVIDPEDREQIERMDEAYQSALDSAPQFHGLGDVMQAALRSLIEEPRPEEPTGLGAVVEDVEGARWTRASGVDIPDPWRRSNIEHWRRYEQIAVVKVLSEGVQP